MCEQCESIKAKNIVLESNNRLLLEKLCNQRKEIVLLKKEIKKLNLKVSYRINDYQYSLSDFCDE